MTEHRFLMADLFPPEDELARWVMVLSIAWQDLLASNLLLLDEAGTESFVGVHNIKKVAAQTWELFVFLRETKERDAVERFVDSLAEIAQQEYAMIFEFVAKPAPPGTRTEVVRIVVEL